MITIEPGLLYLSRSDWGAAASLPRLGYPVSRNQRTELIVHHTVIIDNDATPSLWETLAEVYAKMRQLQTIRPDLGLDVPYNFVFFLMADGSVIVCEGRGLALTGAHTYGHNTKGIAMSGEGNFELPINVGPYIPRLSRVAGWLKYDQGLSSLGSVHPARAIAFGHRDLAQTSCPGLNLYNALPQLQFTQAEEEDDMTPEEAERVFRKVLTEPATKSLLRAAVKDVLDDEDGIVHRIREIAFATNKVVSHPKQLLSRIAKKLGVSLN